MAQSNQDARRAIGQANQDARRGLGQSNQDARRALGGAMVERRTGKAQAADINALVQKPRARQTLRTVDPRGALPAQRGVGSYQPPATSTGGGIAAPLTERLDTGGKADREYHPHAGTFYSNDYMLAVAIRPLKTLNMIDADENEVPFVFGVPRFTE